MSATRETVALVGVRRWGEDETTPVVIDARAACGTWSDHRARGCIGIEIDNGRGASGLLHLTADDALRLADLLRAMA
jgi:hypothetical protein